MQREIETENDLFDLGSVAVETKGIVGLSKDLDQSPLGGAGIRDALIGIDGEMRAMGLRPDGEAWTVAVEQPDPERRAPDSLVSREGGAAAASGDYRHWIDVQGRRLSHTMDPARGAPLAQSPASVTVLAPTCAEADAWATALMVLGAGKCGELARRLGIDALFLLRSVCGIRSRGTGRLYGDATMAVRA